MKLTRDPRLAAFDNLLTGDPLSLPIAWTGDQHYRAVFDPPGNQDTPLIGVYPAGSPCDLSLVGMVRHAAALLQQDGGPALYEVPFSGFTDHRGMEASGQEFSNAYKMVTAWSLQGTLGLMTPFGVVAGGGCDKTFPALIHTMGLEPYRYLPWVLLHAGHRTVGRLPDGREVTIGDLAAARIANRNGRLGDDALEEIRRHTVRDAGVCENLASAMSHYFALCAGGFILAADDLHATHGAGRRAFTERSVALFRQALRGGIVPADTIGPDNFDNFIQAIALFGLSTNLALHLPYMARSWGIRLSPSDIWARIETTPMVSDLQPVGRYPINHVGAMLPSVLRYLVGKGTLKDVTTLFGMPLSELYADAPDLDFTAQDVFRPLDAPVSPGPRVALYRGNLCPGGAWVKESAAMAADRVFTIRMCPTQRDFFALTQGGREFEDGTAYAVTGDKAMIELLTINYAIGQGMDAEPGLEIALLTDQRTSGFAGTRAKAAYHVPRERLRSLKEGDRILFAPSQRIIALVDGAGGLLDTEMDARARNYREPDWPETGTFKDQINRHLSTTEDGAAIY